MRLAALRRDPSGKPEVVGSVAIILSSDLGGLLPTDGTLVV